MSRFLAAIVAAFLLAGSNVEAKQEAFIAGDSICVGLAQASGLKSVARTGAPAREVVSQLRRLPAGATVIVCAGTNDAAARLNGFQASVDAVLAEAINRRQRIIWVGPVSTSLWWDSYSDKADTLLALKIGNYVPMRAVKWAADETSGYHLTPKGYARLWAIVKGKL